MSELLDGGDSGVRHLLQLLAMLPLPDDDDFWDKYTAVPGDPGAKTYTLSKLSVHIKLVLGDGDKLARHHVADLAQYVLMFFAQPRPELHRLLDRVATNFAVDDFGTIGRRWAEDVTATAWALLVTHGRSEDGRAERLAEWADRIV